MHSRESLHSTDLRLGMQAIECSAAAGTAVHYRKTEHGWTAMYAAPSCLNVLRTDLPADLRTRTFLFAPLKHDERVVHLWHHVCVICQDIDTGSKSEKRSPMLLSAPEQKKTGVSVVNNAIDGGKNC